MCNFYEDFFLVGQYNDKQQNSVILQNLFK